MSCADVMYQPYSPYFPVYQRSQVVSTSSSGIGALSHSSVQTATDYRKFGIPKSLDSPLDQPSAALTSACRLPVAPRSTDALPECRGDKEKAGAQYLSPSCVVFTYYSGDISSVVDEHFSRALSQATNYASPEASATKALQTKDGPPMSHRNFPPSFWNSNYQPTPNSNFGGMGPSLGAISVAAATGHPDLTYGSDPYHHPSSLHATLHHQNDPWHYTLASQAGHFSHHRSHDLSSYHPSMSTMPGASRFSPQYSSLLLQPSVRSAARLGSAATCAGLEKSAESWGTARYHDPIGHMDSNYGATYGGMTPMSGLEGQPQESKDLYWF